MAIIEFSHRKRSLNARQKGSVSSLTDTFLIGTDDAAGTLTLKEIEQIAASGIYSAKPILRKRHPDDARFVCTNLQLDQVEAQIYTLTATYTAMVYTANVTGDSTGTSDSPTRTYWTLSRRAHVEDWPRLVETSAPANYDAAWPPAASITGTKVDVWGTPQKYKQWTHEIFLTGFFDTSYLKSDDDDSDVPTKLGLNTYLGKRNSEPFLNYSIGRVAFVGWDEQIVEDPWRSFTLRFIAKEWGHLEQVALPTADGRPLLSTVAAWPGGAVVVKQLATAFWWQPYPDKDNFYNIDPFLEVLDPSPAFPP